MYLFIMYLFINSKSIPCSIFIIAVLYAIMCYTRALIQYKNAIFSV